MRSFSATRGMTLIDVVVGSALVLVIFAGLFGVLRLSLQVAGIARAKAVATSLVNSHMEYIRSLEYGDVGTSGGIPNGVVEQYATTSNSGITYTLRTYIAYVDDPRDGEGAADATGIITDYKLAKVTAYYSVGGASRELSLFSVVAPPGLETTTGGGTIRISTVDAAGLPVAGASVRIVNDATAPAIDFTTFSDATGTVFLPGAPTSTDYQVFVTKDGYSSAQTYERDAVNQNPTPGYLTVAEGSTTTGTFAIDLLATLVIRTFSPIEDAAFTDTFSSNANLATENNTVVSGGAIVLAGGAGAYAPAGTARSTTTAPAYLAEWVSANASLSALPGTSVVLQVTDEAGTLIPDAALPGNSSGFAGVVDLSLLSTTTYPALRLEAALSSGDPLQTPSVADWELQYREGPLPLPDVPFTLTGAKTVGSEIDGTAIFKTSVATTTDATGVRTLSLEWDLYERLISGLTIVGESIEAPYELLPGTTVDASVILTP